MIEVLAKDRVFLNYGPMQAMLSASANGRAMTGELQEAAGYAINILQELAEVLELAKDVRTLNYPGLIHLPSPLRLMVEAVLAAGDQTLTPMAAVAGTFADLTADWLVDRGAAKVLINNGGDIAIRLLGEEKTKVGLTPGIAAPAFTHVIPLDAQDGVGGIATSGFGGRSFTKGIASAVTVLADTARVADACATLIANHCFAEDPGIIRLPAEKLDPNTDIAGHLVTVRIEELRPETEHKALSNGLSKARELIDQEVIRGAVIFLGSQVAMIPDSLCKPV